MQFECPKCKTKIQAADEHAGKKAVCPGCAEMVTIPGTTSAITADPEISTPIPPPADAIAAPEHVPAATKKKPSKAKDDDDERPRRRDNSDGTKVAAAAGMSMAAIVAIIAVVGLCVLCVPAILIALLVPAVQKVRESAARTQTMNNMRQIAIAMHGFHDQRKHFPSSKMEAQQFGAPQPELSWRVTVLPFVEQGGMFQQINKNVAWDNPANQAFLNSQPKTFFHLSRQDQTKPLQDTHFQVFTGPNTPFLTPAFKPTIGSIPDGTSNTFIFAEAQITVPWLKPEDMVVTPPPTALPLPADRFLVAFADGSVRPMERSRISDATLRLLIDPRDGQALPPFD